jgi:predicted RNA-binding protein (virulence factor B family)
MSIRSDTNVQRLKIRRSNTRHVLDDVIFRVLKSLLVFLGFAHKHPVEPQKGSIGFSKAEAKRGLGGAYRDRTDDPLLAKQMLSQLS